MGSDPTRIPVCEACGQRHVRPMRGGHLGQACSKHRKHRSESGGLVPCAGAPVLGTGVCRMHGVSGKVRAAGKRRLAEAQAMTAVEQARASFAIPVDVDPHEAVAEILGTTMATERVLRSMVDKLCKGGTIDEDGKVVAGIYGPDHLGDGRPHVLWSMWRDAAADVTRFSKVAADMGFAERQQSRADRHADFIEGVVTSLLAEFGIDAADPEVGAKVGKVLTLAAARAA